MHLIVGQDRVLKASGTRPVGSGFWAYPINPKPHNKVENMTKSFEFKPIITKNAFFKKPEARKPKNL